MKKFFPILLIITIFCAFILIHIIQDKFIDYDNIDSLTETIKYNQLYKNFQWNSTSGKQFKLSDFSNSLILINFWASWCRPCLRELPTLVKLKDKYNDIIIITVNSDIVKNYKKVNYIFEKFNNNFFLIKDPYFKIGNNFNIKQLPTTLVFFKNNFIEKLIGEHDFSSKENIIKFDKILNQ